jgi:Na+/H+ antiporter NhaD/arsenite permease-like protein
MLAVLAVLLLILAMAPGVEAQDDPHTDEAATHEEPEAATRDEDPDHADEGDPGAETKGAEGPHDAEPEEAEGHPAGDAPEGGGGHDGAHDGAGGDPGEDAHDDHGDGHHGTDLGAGLPLWTIVPFIGILLSIALFPLTLPDFWHHHFGKISAGWAVLFGLPFLAVYGGDAFYEIAHIYLVDYIPFILLLWALFTISGGVVVRAELQGSPVQNTVFLIVGTVIASWIGTTGASMVLIRPVLKANAWRRHKVHVVVFFIFLVSNIGGSLTPLGDPPLFLGFLHQVPFFWTMSLLPHMAFLSVILLVLFFFVDRYYYSKETPPEADGGLAAFRELQVVGLHNFLLLGGVVAAVLMSGVWRPGEIEIFGVHLGMQNLLRDALLVILGLLSLWLTDSNLRTENGFTWFPIVEVAKLFAGIFMTIIPALAILKAGDAGALAGLVAAVKEPVHYFWVTGTLSSFLDNAPTYLTFFNTALGSLGMPESQVPAMLGYVEGVQADPQFVRMLVGISIGAVFMGANTYIGNAPNFMVKSIAEEAGVAMPSFFGYMKWSLGILVPIFVIVSLVFL